jgi:hypothetical protein
MKKYPSLSSKTVKRCLSKIDKSTFNTYEFIKVWSKYFPDELNQFSGIGVGWRKVIGRELSLFSQTNSELKKLDKRRGNAQMWLKK